MATRVIKRWTWVAGLLTIVVGLPYVLGFYGPAEAEVRTWGNMVIIAAVRSLFLLYRPSE